MIHRSIGKEKRLRDHSWRPNQSTFRPISRLFAQSTFYPTKNFSFFAPVQTSSRSAIGSVRYPPKVKRVDAKFTVRCSGASSSTTQRAFHGDEKLRRRREEETRGGALAWSGACRVRVVVCRLIGKLACVCNGRYRTASDAKHGRVGLNTGHRCQCPRRDGGAAHAAAVDLARAGDA